MRGLLKLLILSVTIKCVSAFNFTSDDFDETSHHINHESIATISSDYKSDDEETNQNTSEDFYEKTKKMYDYGILQSYYWELVNQYKTMIHERQLYR